METVAPSALLGGTVDENATPSATTLLKSAAKRAPLGKISANTLHQTQRGLDAKHSSDLKAVKHCTVRRVVGVNCVGSRFSAPSVARVPTGLSPRAGGVCALLSMDAMGVHVLPVRRYHASDFPRRRGLPVRHSPHLSSDSPGRFGQTPSKVSRAAWWTQTWTQPGHYEGRRIQRTSRASRQS